MVSNDGSLIDFAADCGARARVLPAFRFVQAEQQEAQELRGLVP